MIRVELHIGGQVLRFASEPLDYDGYFWEGRINNSVDIQRVFAFTDKTGNRKRSLSFNIDNSDDFFVSLHEQYSLLNKKIVVYCDDGSNLTKKMVGHTTEIISFSRILNIGMSEIDNLYFDQPIPDMQLAYDYYAEGGYNENWNAIPIIFGNVNRLKVAWFDNVNFRFMISTGELASVKKVYFDKEVMYDVSTGKNGYKATVDSKNIKVRIYKGSENEIVDGKASAKPNCAYIEFYDEATGNAIEPTMTDGKVPEIYVDVAGVINDARNGPERNPARLLHKLLTYPSTGFNGWGMGVPAVDVNLNEAMGWCDLNGIVIDGVIDKRQDASAWIDELCVYIGGALVEENGILTMVVDKPVNIVSADFDESGELGFNCNISEWKEPGLTEQINRLRIYYKFNYEFDNFDKKPDVNEESPCGSSQLRNEAHQLKIGQWNTANLELKWFSEDEPAHKIAQTIFKRDILQLKTITFVTELSIPSSLDVRQKIRITSKRFGWIQKEFTIKEILKSDKQVKIVAKEYNAEVYNHVLDLTPVEYVRVEYGKYDIPLKPTNLTVSQTTTPRADGTLQTVLSLQATKLATNIQKILYFRKKSGETTWQQFHSSESESTNVIFNREDGDYYIRAVSITPYGVMSDIEIASGDSHYIGYPSTEGKITIYTNYDTVYVPSAPSLGVYFKTVRIECTQGATKSKDLIAFSIWRSETNNSATATKVGEISASGNSSTITFLDESTAYGKTYYYWIKAINSSGISSGFSSGAGPITTNQVSNADLGSLSVGLAQICTDAVRECHLYAGSVTALKIGAAAILACHVSTNTIITNSANIGCGVINSAHISSLTADKISTGTIGVGGSITVCGSVYASTGCFRGDVYASNGCFNGTVYASTGCFRGAVYAESGSFTGAVYASSGSFTGTVYASTGCFRGAVYAESGSFTGTIYAANGCFNGCLYSSTGTIGGFTLLSSSMYSAGAGYEVYLNASGSCPSLQVSRCYWYSTVGRAYWGSAWQNTYGFSLAYYSYAPVFAVGIAYDGSQYLPSGTTVSQWEPFFFVGSSTKYLQYYGGVVTVSGNIYSSSGNIGGFCLTSTGFCRSWTTGNGTSFMCFANDSGGATMDFSCYCNGYGQFLYFNSSYDGQYTYTAPFMVGTNVLNTLYAMKVSGGVYITGCSWAVCHYNTSSRTLKHNFTDVNVLDRLKSMKIQAWQRYDDTAWGIGPVAEDVYDYFRLGTGKSIPSLDGLALRAIQEVDDKVNQSIFQLTESISSIDKRLKEVENKLSENQVN